MVEAISEELTNYSYTSEESSEWSFFEFSSTCIYATEPTTLDGMIHHVFHRKQELAQKIVNKLYTLGYTRFEKKLGEGAFGIVLKIQGDEKKDLALKLEKHPTPLANTNNELVGDAQGLNLPTGHHLGRALALLTYYEGEVHYIESFDPMLHSEHLLVGVFSKAVDGVPLYNRVSVAPLDSEAVKGYGKQLAEALLALHSAGYVHNDLHQGNILVKNSKEGKDPYRLKLLDFGCANEATPRRVDHEWKNFAYLLAEMGSEKQLNNNPKFNDLLYNPERGIFQGKLPYSGREIVNHPFFV